VAWILRLVKIGAEGERRSVNVMEIHRPDHLGNIADLGERARERGLTLGETKRLLGGLQQEIVAVQLRNHAVGAADIGVQVRPISRGDASNSCT
jgi:hypothetical protein